LRMEGEHIRAAVVGHQTVVPPVRGISCQRYDSYVCVPKARTRQEFLHSFAGGVWL
jgi:hypothetical protein